MNWTTAKIVILALLCAIAICALSWFAGSIYGRRAAFVDTTTQSDTVVKVVTVYKDFPDPVKTSSAGFVRIPKYIFLSDTVGVPVQVPGPTDTQYVYLPREQKYYEEEEGRLRMWVSGYDPRLDRYEWDAVTATVTNTVYIKPSRWSFSISGGWGLTYDVIGKKFGTGPTIVVGGSWSF